MVARTSMAYSTNCSIFLQFSPLLHGIYFTLSITSDINGAEEMAYQIKAFVIHVWWKVNQLYKLALCLHMCTVACTHLYCRCTYMIITKRNLKILIKGRKNKTESMRNSNYLEAITTSRAAGKTCIFCSSLTRHHPCPRSLGHISLGILH